MMPSVQAIRSGLPPEHERMNLLASLLLVETTLFNVTVVNAQVRDNENLPHKNYHTLELMSVVVGNREFLSVPLLP